MWVPPFTVIDDGEGLAQVQDFIEERQPLRLTGGRFLFQGLMEAVSQLTAASATLPDGPKAIVTVECCGGRGSLSDVVAMANAGGVPIFNVHTGNEDGRFVHTVLPSRTGGVHVRNAGNTATIGTWLRDGYRVTIPQTAVDDCNRHKIEVTVRGESKEVDFSRCDTTPEFFRLKDFFDVEVSTHVRARAVIRGIDTAVRVRIDGGQYSVGCTTAYTSEPGWIGPDESICVRHTTSAIPGGLVITGLTIGGIREALVSQTAGAGP